MDARGRMRKATCAAPVSPASTATWQSASPWMTWRPSSPRP